MPEIGVSRARARVLHEKRKKGLRRGPGTREGTSKARFTKKDVWMLRIRALRKALRAWKTVRSISEGSYRRLYMIAGGGKFNSIGEMERYAKTHGMWRKR